MSPTPPDRLNPALARRDVALWFAAVILFAFLEFLVAREAAGGLVFTTTPTNYYHYATDAALSGQLSLKISPRPELFSLSDPYDSALNQPYRLQDISLYRGKYYFYWGMSPVVLFFAPIRLATGWWPSESLAIAFFGVVCIAAFSWILLAIRRVFFPLAGCSTAILSVLCLEACTLLLGLSANNHVYGVPISCAAACYSIAWWAALRAVITPKRTVQWSLVCGLALALAVGARPNYILWAPAFVFVLLAAIRSWPGKKYKIIIAAIAPIFLVVGCLLWMNVKRFDHALEFGQKYQLSGSRQLDIAFWGPKYLAGAWKAYGWNPLQLNRYFPFVLRGPEEPFGIFCALPIAWLAVGLICVPACRELQGWLRALALSCGLSFVAGCFFSGSVLRYMVDFLPGIVLAGGVCALALDHHYGRRLACRSILAALLGVSVLAGSLIQIESWSVSRPMRSRLLRPLARVMNIPAFAWDATHAPPAGGRRLVLDFPKDRLGAYEPILSVPDKPSDGVLIFVHYTNPKHIRLGFFQTGSTHWLSEPISTDYSANHTIDIRLGALAPPESHPAYGQWPEAAVQETLGQVDIHFDDSPVYHTTLDFDSSHGDPALPGQNCVSPGVSAPAFTGKILSSRRLALSPPAPPLNGSWMTNPIDFAFYAMPNLGPGDEEVFLSQSDSLGRSTQLVINHLPNSRIAFVLRTTGHPDREGPALPSLSIGPHRLLWSIGSWRVSPTSKQRSRFEVYLDDALVLSGSTDGLIGAPSLAIAGSPPANADPGLKPFSGFITEAIPVPASASELTSSARNRLHYGPWRLRVRFPAGPPHGYHDPILVSGTPGKGDFIYAFYPKPGTVAFSHDCWGYGGETSRTVAIDLNLEHQIEIEHGGLYPPLNDPLWAHVPPNKRADYKSKLRITLDGIVVLEGNAYAADASPTSITPGINSIGGSSTAPQFLGQLISAERLDW